MIHTFDLLIKFETLIFDKGIKIEAIKIVNITHFWDIIIIYHYFGFWF